MATDRESRDPYQPVDFAPARVGAPRRTLDPLALGAAVVGVALVVAIVKPWGDASTATAGDGLSPAPRASASDARLPVGSAMDALTERDGDALAVAILAALERRDGWGARIVVAEPGAAGAAPVLTERWRARQGADPDRAIRFQEDAPIVALGVTAPGTTAPLALRTWKLQADGTWRWLDARRPDSSRPAADLLLLPPGDEGGPAQGWSTGRYRIDVLLGADIARLEVSIDTPAPMGFESDLPVVDRGEGIAWPGILVAGPFALVGGRVESLLGAPLTHPTEATAWLDLDEAVARVAGPAVAGLGVALAPGSSEVTGTIRRLAPGPLPAGSEVAEGRTEVRLDAAARPVVAVRFDPVDGRAVPMGVYALAVRWREADVERDATWVVEVGPADDAPSTALLQAARRYATHAGTGTLVFRAGGRQAPADDEPPVRTLPLGRAIGCGSDLIDETPAVLGFAPADGSVLLGGDARLLAPLGRTIDIPLRIVPAVVPGLSLVAPGRGAAFAAGIYRLALETSTGPRQVTLCLGTSPFSG